MRSSQDPKTECFGNYTLRIKHDRELRLKHNTPRHIMIVKGRGNADSNNDTSKIV